MEQVFGFPPTGTAVAALPGHGSPMKHRKNKPTASLGQLTQPGALQALTSHIQQRLIAQPPTTETNPILPSTGTSTNSWEELLLEEVQRILTDSSWTRTSKDLQLTCQRLQSYEAFKDYPLHIQKQLCRVGWYQRVEPGRVIFWEGQQPSSFYLILSGSVKMLRKGSAAYNETIQTLKSGQHFGDTAITKRQLRSTTCVANSTAEFLVISKSDYIDLSLRQSRLSYQRAKHFTFCKTVGLLKYFPIGELESQPELCIVNYFKPNAVVVKDSRKCDWVYIIMTGSCRVVKRFINSNEFGRMSLQQPTRDSRVRKVGFPDILDSGLAAGQLQSQIRGGDDSSPYGHKIRRLERKQKSLSSLVPAPVQKQFLVQLQILHPKDTFGLSSILHSSEPSISLVSNGADIVMISKEFLIGHMSEVLKVKLQRKVMQYPSEEAMRKRIRDHNSWKVYKHSMVHQVKAKQII